MKEIILASLNIGFKREIIQYESLILLALVAYWLGARWEAIQQRFSPEGLGRTLLWLIFGFAAFFAVVSAMDWGSEYALLAITLGLGVGLAMCDTAISICFFVVLLFLRPQELFVDNDFLGVLPKLTMSLCIANALLKYAREKKITVYWSRTATFLVSFAVWCLLTTFRGMNPDVHQALLFDNFFKCVFLFTLTLNVIDSVPEIDLIVWSIVITMFGVGLVSIHQTAVTSEALEYIVTEKVRLMGFGAFANSNDIGALMVMVLPFALVPIVQKGTSMIMRVLGAAVVAMVIECVRLSQSRGALLGVLVIVGLMILGTMKNRKLAIVLAVTSALGVAAVAKVSGRSEADLNESQEIRLVYIQTGIMMGLKNPIMGVGFDGYGDNFNQYQTKPVADTIGHRTAHNSWVLAFGETGGVGLFLYAAVYFTSLIGAFRYRKERPEFFLAVLGYGIAMTFLSHTYFIFPYLLYGLSGVAMRQYMPLAEARMKAEAAAVSASQALPVPSA